MQLSAQRRIFDVQLFTVKDGLDNNSVKAIFKDSKGFLWIGTDYGLNCFDGYNFRSYTKRDPSLVPKNSIKDIREDSDGNLWLFYFEYGDSSDKKRRLVSAIDIFDPITGEVTPFESFWKEELPFNTSDIILPKIFDNKKQIWITTDKGQLFRYEEGYFKKLYENRGESIKHLAVNSDNNIWIGLNTKLICLDSTGAETERLDLSQRVEKLWIGKNDRLWFVTTEEGVYFDRRDTLKQYIWTKTKLDSRQKPFVLTYNGTSQQLKTRVHSVYQNGNGYWISNVTGSWGEYDKTGKYLSDIHVFDKKEVRIYDRVRYFDKNDIWLKAAEGLLRISTKVNPFNPIHKNKNLFNDCRGITEDRDSNIYFINTHTYKWNPVTKKVQKVSPFNFSTYALFWFDNILWEGSYKRDILGNQIDLRNPEDEFKYFVKNQPSIAYSLFKTKNADEFIIGQNKGVAKLNIKKRKLSYFLNHESEDKEYKLLKNSHVYYIHKNKYGIWLATSNGVFLMKENGVIIRHFNKKNGDLPFNHIQYLYEDTAGVYWLATRKGGIIQWYPDITGNSRLISRQFTTSNGLSNNNTYAIYEDDYERLWIPSDNGLMCMDKKTYEVRTYTTEDGLPHNEFNLTSHYQAKDGTLYFGGLGGLISFHPSLVVRELEENQIPLVVTKYSILEQAAEEPSDRTELLKSSKEIIIHPGDKFFELKFALLDYDLPERHKYSYIIEGYSDRVNYIDENFLRITHLPSGSYTLKIRGQNINKGWSENELSLKIRVLAPFYKRWWFFVLLFLFGIGLVTLLIKAREARLRESKKQLETEVAMRTKTIRKRTEVIEQQAERLRIQAENLKELDIAKTRFFSNITHEFRTPLTLIIGPIEQFLEENGSDVKTRSLSGTLKNARRLLKLINQLLDLSKLESGEMKTEYVYGDITDYTLRMVREFKVLAEKKGQVLYYSTDRAVTEISFDAGKWDKIVYNLLSNAIKFTPIGGDIYFSLKSEGEELLLKVKNTGVSMKSNHIGKVFNRFYQRDNSSTREWEGTGIGLSLVKELTELQGGHVSAKSNESENWVLFEIRLPKRRKQAAGKIKIPDLKNEEEVESAGVISEESKRPTIEEVKEKYKLLLIEDNDEMRAYIRSCINESEYEITEAENGAKGIEKALSEIPDMIISDVMMPEKDGYEVLEILRQDIRTSHIPIILLTAKVSRENRIEGLSRGADAYLTKPFSPRELKIRINQLIEIRRLLRKRYQGKLPKNEETVYKNEDAFITELRTYILENIEETDLNGDRIGRHFGISRGHLYLKLKALTGQSLTQYVKSIRLEQAIELLKEGKLNISEVSWKTGFTSISIFSRAFKQVYGTSPSKIKKRRVS